MKKSLFTILLLIFCMQSAMAVNVSVESITPVNIEDAPTNYAAKILKDTKINNDITFKKNSIINMEIIKLVPAKSFKRSAYMVARPIFIADDEIVLPLDELKLEAKTTTIKVVNKEDLKKNLGKNIKNAGINAGLKAATTMVPGSNQMLQISKGLIKPEEGKTRLQSATGNLTDSLPTKYLKKGKPLDIKEGDKIVLKFYEKKSNNVKEVTEITEEAVEEVTDESLKEQQ